ncbi:BTB/POZ domain-containing protein 17-like [Amphiura filiformis]|uniref:BTB/POZ domain-containing protein 17-like n=1 Tax=Amphiura filiformis TaxID=82378 RepID=UPI003B227382
MAKPTKVDTLDENLQSKVAESTLDDKTAVLENLSQQLYVTGNYFDVTLVVAEKRYPVHKAILAASSPYFQLMFYGGTWKEGSSGEVKLVETPSCEEAFEMFLRYFYSGTVTVTNKTVISIVTLADKYDVQSLKDTCTKYMVDMLYNKGDVEAALGWVTFADQMSMHDLQQKCYDLICFDFDKACNLTSWLSLSLEQIVTILERSDIVVYNEYTVFQAVEKWLLGHSVTEKEVKSVLSHIRFKNMTVDYLCQVEKSQLASLHVCKENHLLTLCLSSAFRYLAIQKSYPHYAIVRGDNKPEEYQRIYMESSGSLSVAAFEGTGNGKCASLKPTCTFSSETEYYKWELGKFDSSGKYQVRLPSVSRVGSRPTYSHFHRREISETLDLYSDLPEDICIKLALFMRNKAGHTIEAISGSFVTQIPEENGQIIVEFPEHGSTSNPEFAPHDVMYSFSIEEV